MTKCYDGIVKCYKCLRRTSKCRYIVQVWYLPKTHQSLFIYKNNYGEKLKYPNNPLGDQASILDDQKLTEAVIDFL